MAQTDPATSTRIAAFFDVDGTIVDGNIVRAYAHIATRGMSWARKALWTTRFAMWIPLFLAVDSFSRSAFNTVFYRHYRGLDAGVIETAATETFPELGLSSLLPEAQRAVRRHQECGHLVVLVSGTTSFVARPLADYLAVEHVFAAQLEVEDGRFTGRLSAPPLSDERKAEVVCDFAERHDVDLSLSHAYGDSAADSAMLGAVGNPVAVNPSRRLRALARTRGWRIEEWRQGPA